jgi:hypothetical protein
MADTDTIDKRVSDLETLVWDIPNLLNARFQRFEAALADNTARLASVERTLTGLQTDVRDLRGGVTRQLVAQDGRLAAIESKLDEALSRLPKAP